MGSESPHYTCPPILDNTHTCGFVKFYKEFALIFCCFLLTNKGEGGHLMSKRGLHFFRLRRSSHCVDMDSETLRQILVGVSFDNNDLSSSLTSWC
ncbi:hypothetical protein EGR_10108 [Echinococcus granulosus]|uniref:Uncharacterized protein n=1 Tax=Echinococcus granulosus TaxID=6210 RepID=W6U3B5_ECHGR|nr:hypothetical protein EGR_10108 [Echinococcus granulosus]EUB55036.1 hypothetical protein EGR_10108 [Echinococcus granulosus]